VEYGVLVSPLWQWTCSLCFICAWISVIPHLPYSWDLLPCDLYRFPNLKMFLQEEEITILSQSKVTILAKLWDALAKFHKQYFMKCLEWWCDHWTHCTKSQRDGFAKRTTLIRSICYHYEEIKWVQKLFDRTMHTPNKCIPSFTPIYMLQYHIILPYSRRWWDVHPQTEAEWDSCLPHCEECSQTPSAAQGGWGKVLWWAPGPLVFVLLEVSGISTIIEHYGTALLIQWLLGKSQQQQHQRHQDNTLYCPENN